MFDPHRVAFDRDSLKMPLIVRRRRPGDLFRPLGAPGTRKLKKYMIDQKIPADQRNRAPIICDSAGILWVAGYQRSERGRLSADTREYVMMELLKNDCIH
jgi:tRNA(Ile)-lysidine synthase